MKLINMIMKRVGGIRRMRLRKYIVCKLVKNPSVELVETNGKVSAATAEVRGWQRHIAFLAQIFSRDPSGVAS